MDPLSVFDTIPNQFVHPEANSFLSQYFDPGTDYDDLMLTRLNLLLCNTLLEFIAPHHKSNDQQAILSMPQSYTMVKPSLF